MENFHNLQPPEGADEIWTAKENPSANHSTDVDEATSRDGEGPVN